MKAWLRNTRYRSMGGATHSGSTITIYFGMPCIMQSQSMPELVPCAMMRSIRAGPLHIAQATKTKG